LSVEEVEPGETVEYVLNRFIFRGVRFGFYMAADALPFDQYTPEQLEEGNFGFYSDADGRMPDDSIGWEYQ
jgi:hypothetical protein